MSTSKPAVPARRPWWKRLRMIVCAAAMLSIGGWWAFSSSGPRSESSSDAELDEEIALFEVTGMPPTRDRTTRPATATFTDVVAAGHLQDEEERSFVMPAGMTSAGMVSERPASNPSVWLVGTIEEVESGAGTRSSRRFD